MHFALVLAMLLGASDAPAAGHPRVRGASAREHQMIQDLLTRSPTARRLAAEIQTSDVIVYVQLTPSEGPGRAATRMLAASGDTRFLRITMGAMTLPGERPSLLAHELQHAVEIARARDVRDADGMRRLYARIGENRGDQFSFETKEARAVGLRARREFQRGVHERPESAPAEATSTASALRDALPAAGRGGV